MRPALAHITAALDADPFADPVSVCGVALPRAQARRFERELVAQGFPAVPSTVARAGDCPNGGASALLPNRQRPAGEPARAILPSNHGGPGFPLFNCAHATSNTSQVQHNHGC